VPWFGELTNKYYVVVFFLFFFGGGVKDMVNKEQEDAMKTE